MRKLAFITTLLGILTLALILLLQNPIEIKSKEDLQNLKDNQLVSISGSVVNEKIYTSNRLLILDNGLSIYCECKDVLKLQNKNITIKGIVDTFQKSKINVLKVSW